MFKKYKKIILPCLIITLIAGATSLVYFINKSSIKTMAVDSIPESEATLFDETITNNFIQPNVSARLSGKVRNGYSVQSQYRDGVTSLEINHDTLWLTINIGKKEIEGKMDYYDPVIISNSTEPNLGRYKFSEETYSEGYEGWQYFNNFTGSGCNESRFCGSGLIEKGNDVIFNIVCSYQTSTNNVNECDEIMKSLEIDVVN